MDSQTIDELSKEIEGLQSRLNVILVLLIIFILLSSLSFLHTIFNFLADNLVLLLFLLAILGVGIIVAFLILVDIELHGKNE